MVLPTPVKHIKARETDGAYVYTGTILTSSKSQLVMSTEFRPKAEWSRALVWSTCTPTPTEIVHVS